jgi:hypothetical protein
MVLFCTACGQRRQPELSALLLHDLRGMEENAPNTETLCAVLRVLGRCDRLDEAFALVFGDEWHGGFVSRERDMAKLPAGVLRVKRFKRDRVAAPPLYVDAQWKGATHGEPLSLAEFGATLGVTAAQDEQLYTALINASASDAR